MIRSFGEYHSLIKIHRGINVNRHHIAIFRTRFQCAVRAKPVQSRKHGTDNEMITGDSANRIGGGFVIPLGNNLHEFKFRLPIKTARALCRKFLQRLAGGMIFALAHNYIAEINRAVGIAVIPPPREFAIEIDSDQIRIAQYRENETGAGEFTAMTFPSGRKHIGEISARLTLDHKIPVAFFTIRKARHRKTYVDEIAHAPPSQRRVAPAPKRIKAPPFKPAEGLLRPFGLGRVMRFVPTAVRRLLAVARGMAAPHHLFYAAQIYIITTRIDKSPIAVLVLAHTPISLFRIRRGGIGHACNHGGTSKDYFSHIHFNFLYL